MRETELRTRLVRTGKELLEEGLVARTWGNVSARVSEQTCLISPSGLDYNRTTEDDIVLLNLETGEAAGGRKPSSEKAVHVAAYRCFPEVQFVIHTHQKYASVIGLTGEDGFKISEEERALLGGAGFASYGRPGTKTLSDAVEAVLSAGCQTVFMKHHGVLICGQNKEETMQRARLLETICERIVRDCGVPDGISKGARFGTALLDASRAYLHSEFVECYGTDSIRACADSGRAIPACLDDMAQMIGAKIPVAGSVKKAVMYLRRHNVVLIPGRGALIKAQDADDLEALKLLTDKAACVYLYCRARGEKHILPASDTAIMRAVYRFGYAKRKAG